MSALRYCKWIPVLIGTNLAAYFLILEITDWMTDRAFVFDFSDFAVVAFGMPLGVLFTFGLAAAIEWITVGYCRSSLGKLFSSSSHSSRTDWFYLFFTLSGLKPVAGFLLSLGMTVFAAEWAAKWIGFRLVQDSPWFLQLLTLAVVKSFGFYVVHAVMHSPLFWEIHKVHHSATELTVLTPHRNHPVDVVVVSLMNAVLIALLGVSAPVAAAYLFINGFYQSLIHSEMTWGRPWLDRYILFSPEAHRIHHSNDSRHWHKNLGTIPLWDHLFGTFMPPHGEKVESIGFSEAGFHNSGRPLLETWAVLTRWLRELWPTRVDAVEETDAAV